MNLWVFSFVQSGLDRISKSYPRSQPNTKRQARNQARTTISSSLTDSSSIKHAFDGSPVFVASLVSVNGYPADRMNRNHLERCHEMGAEERSKEGASGYVSMEAEIPEVLYRGMKDFIGVNPNWDQYRLMSSALAHFLFQNGAEDRAVTERYLDDLFILRNC